MGCTCGAGPYEGDYFDGDRPDTMVNVKFVESAKMDPALAGCADGQREGFADMTRFPRVAGCMGKWTDAKNLRDAPTGKACGDDGEVCAVPADVCAPGWHVCGSKGDPKDIRDRLDGDGCHAAGPGRFNAAMSHSPTDEIEPCPIITASTKLPCVQAGLGAEPVCCGDSCLYGKCKDGVWKDKTKISRGTSEGCGSVTSDHNGGVMCCYDGADAPVVGAAAASAPAPAGGSGAPADAKPEEGKAAEGKAAEGKSDGAKGDMAKPAEGKAGDAKAAPAKVEGAEPG
jgi:hypothetical protein